MSVLNDIKKLRKLYPNDMEFGTNVAKYLEVNKTCCDKPENVVPFNDNDSGPYGWDVAGTQCKQCGTRLTLEIDKS